MSRRLLLAFIGFALACVCHGVALRQAADEAADVVSMTMLQPARRLSRRLLGFSWHDCGGSGDPVRLTSLSVSPDPVKLSGSITVAFNATVTSQVAAPISASVKLKRKIFGAWVEIPCIDNVGSCNYGDVCSMAPSTCPAPLIAAKIPCKCPIPAGSYSLPSYTFTIGSEIPSFLESGSYQVEVQGTAGGKQAFCIAAEASLD